MSYTFGDNEEASYRLRRLAEVYEPETRALLNALFDFDPTYAPQLAVDLGCGPGWSTQLLRSILRPQRTIGLDASERYITEARINHAQIEFFKHNILESPFPVDSPDLLFCRFLLTHLSSPQKALQSWANLAAYRAKLLIHETEKLESDNPALQRYYQLVDEMQKHHGQALNVGADLDDYLSGSEWLVLHSRSVVLEKSARDMAQLHLLNLRTWGRNEYALQAFDRNELDELEKTLEQIAFGAIDAGVVHNTARQIIAERK